MTSNKVINQHTVSQSYLRFFANKQEQTYVFDKLQSKAFPTHIRNVASGRYFYDFPEGISPDEEVKLPDQFIEKLFSEIEGEYPKKIRKIISSYYMSHPEKVYTLPVFSGDDKLEMAELMALQILRTKEYRAGIIELYEKFNKSLLDEFIQEEDPDFDHNSYELKFNDEFSSVLHATQLLNPEFIDNMAQILEKHIWLVLVNKTELPFYTSDTPVVKRANIENEFISYGGYASEGIEIHYPLNSKFTLSLVERSHFKDLESKENCFIPLDDVETIKYQNSLQISQAYRQVFCAENKFDMAFDFCREYPDICNDKNQQRVDVHAFGRKY
ncbi:DUF4238 domain-containing protein [Paenibacillus sp. 2KB_22]|uniref:DUF4238 domain-containing protein n=1 Tax=Paenibacillus sp. 2KB_22 TaxID=3232978 RepID=UPI003F980AE9